MEVVEQLKVESRKKIKMAIIIRGAWRDTKKLEGSARLRQKIDQVCMAKAVMEPGIFPYQSDHLHKTSGMATVTRNHLQIGDAIDG